MTVTLWVPGTPAPQGSKRHVGGGRMVESSKRLPGWRAAVEHAARQWAGTHFGAWEPLTGPVSVSLEFYLPRPKRYVRELPHVRPDIDKLTRGVFDALTNARIFDDDGQVCELSALKLYGPEAGVRVTVHAL